jgi:Cof subfamily protein (haloacid dehalogenase superfamily)
MVRYSRGARTQHEPGARSRTMHPRLLCLDLDGTLLQSDDSIAAIDRAALDRARREGVLVTIGTGRLVSGALPTARALGIEVPIICADGGVIAHATSGAALECTPMTPDTAAACLSTMLEHALLPLLFHPDVIHGHAGCRDFAPYFSSWSPAVAFHDRLAATAPLDEVVLALALGTQGAVEAARDALTHDHRDALEVAWFPFGTEWFAVRVQPRGCSKGAALAQLAARLGIAREDVAAVGDWLNDISMLAWAGRSFAMGHAPEIVRAAATDTLASTAATGGGVAEAVDRWLGSWVGAG